MTTSTSVRLICFDLDGTLIDSVKDIADSLNQLLFEHGHKPAPVEQIRAAIGEGPLLLLQKIMPEMMQDPNQKALLTARFMEIYALKSSQTTALFDGVEDFLTEWTQKGGYIGLITNKSERLTHKVFQELNLNKFPWIGIYAAETWAERKPSPLPLQKMMEAARVSPQETLMIGDGTPDMASAQAAGVRSIAMEFGYTSLDILKKYHPVGILKNYHCLMSLVASLDERHVK